MLDLTYVRMFLDRKNTYEMKLLRKYAQKHYYQLKIELVVNL